MNNYYLSLSEVLDIHQDQVVRYGGAAGIRDLDLLKSALGMPSVTFSGEYLHTDIFEMAAAYLFHIVKNHPFIDGNKSVGAVSTLIFLAFNGYDLTVSQDKFASFVIGVAKSDINKAKIALIFRKWAEKL